MHRAMGDGEDSRRRVGYWSTGIGMYFVVAGLFFMLGWGIVGGPGGRLPGTSLAIRSAQFAFDHTPIFGGLCVVTGTILVYCGRGILRQQATGARVLLGLLRLALITCAVMFVWMVAIVTDGTAFRHMPLPWRVICLVFVFGIALLYAGTLRRIMVAVRPLGLPRPPALTEPQAGSRPRNGPAEPTGAEGKEGGVQRRSLPGCGLGRVRRIVRVGLASSAVCVAIAAVVALVGMLDVTVTLIALGIFVHILTWLLALLGCWRSTALSKQERNRWLGTLFWGGSLALVLLAFRSSEG